MGGSLNDGRAERQDHGSVEQRQRHGGLLQPVRQDLHGSGVRGDLLPPPQQGRAGNEEDDGPGERERSFCKEPGRAAGHHRAGDDGGGAVPCGGGDRTEAGKDRGGDPADQ